MIALGLLIGTKASLGSKRISKSVLMDLKPNINQWQINILFVNCLNRNCLFLSKF